MRLLAVGNREPTRHCALSMAACATSRPKDACRLLWPKEIASPFGVPDALVSPGDCRSDRSAEATGGKRSTGSGQLVNWSMIEYVRAGRTLVELSQESGRSGQPIRNDAASRAALHIEVVNTSSPWRPARASSACSMRPFKGTGIWTASNRKLLPKYL